MIGDVIEYQGRPAYRGKTIVTHRGTGCLPVANGDNDAATVGIVDVPLAPGYRRVHQEYTLCQEQCPDFVLMDFVITDEEIKTP